MTDYTRLYNLLKESPAKRWLDTMPMLIDDSFSDSNHGRFTEWESSLSEIHVSKKDEPVLLDGKISFNSTNNNSVDNTEKLTERFMKFHPWRKGPYEISGVTINTEWRSDLKWNRLQQHIAPLAGKNVLDIGSGNGYHLWRMVMEGARLALGIDPYLLSVMQFNLINKFSVELPIFTVPLGVDDIPNNLNGFDTLFSMGLLYHRRNPVEHIEKLFQTLILGGELVLESLIIESDKIEFFVPKGRYAKMRNVWNLPSVSQIEAWLIDAGFKDVRCVDITKTALEEQRSTAWMEFESLPDFLDPSNLNKTVEGHPAPVRAIFCAKRPL